MILPDLTLFQSYGGEWQRYLDALYSHFTNDFIVSKPVFKGQRLGLKRYPLYKNKEATFWHLISKGQVEEDRTPEIRRCERIKWPRPIIDNSDNEHIKIWENKRGNEIRICLCYGDWEYLVILAKRNGYILPWTAYPIEYGYKKIKLEKEHLAYKKLNPPIE